MLKRLLLLALVVCIPALSQTSQHPNVRAITAFVKLDRTNYETQLGEALKFLQAAKEDYTKAGWNVQTIRITTQPFPEYTRGMNKADAVKFLYSIDAWCTERKVDLNIG